MLQAFIGFRHFYSVLFKLYFIQEYYFNHLALTSTSLLVSRGQQMLNSTLANGRAMVESRYHNFGHDSEIHSHRYLKNTCKSN